MAQEAIRILVPAINPNEPEAQVVALAAAEGQEVAQGDLLCTLETTKATAEVHAEAGGFVAGWQAAAGDLVRSGETLCWIAPDGDWRPPARPETTPSQAGPQGLRITEPARSLALEVGLDLSQLPLGPLITEKALRALLAERQDGLQQSGFDPRALLLYGGGGHGKSLIDLIRSLGSYDLVGVIDDGLEPGANVMGVPLLGGADQLADQHARGVRLAVNAVGGVGNVGNRIRVFDRLQASGFGCPTLIHPHAFVESSAVLSAGVQIFPHAYVGSEAQLGFGVIVNTAAVISHDCRLEAYVNVAPGSLLAGGVVVGEGVLIGMGVTINLGVRIGERARVGNSAVIKDDVPAGTVVRAGSIWPLKT